MTGLEVTDRSISRPFFYARSVLVEDENNLVAAGGVNDHESFIIRIRGIATILHEAIEEDADRIEHERSEACFYNAERRRLYQDRIEFAESAMENWIKVKNHKVLDNLFFTRKHNVN